MSQDIVKHFNSVVKKLVRPSDFLFFDVLMLLISLLE